MTNVLLFKNDNNIASKMIDERMEVFGKTLNDLFIQFQKLWGEYKELLEKFEESKSDTLTAQNGAKEINSTCTTSTNQNVVLQKEGTALLKENKVDDDRLPVETSQQMPLMPVPDSDQPFQIFSQDFCTQGLEESFTNQSKIPLLEIQNVNRERTKSPVFGSKKGKPCNTLSPINSQNVSQESVVMLNDLSNEPTDSTLNISLDSSVNTTATKICSTPNHWLSPPITEVSAKCTPKNVKKLGISTLHNIHTNIVRGSNKKLKQSKLFMKAEKVTDLSACDDVFDDKSKDSATKTNELINTNCTSTNNSYLEESLILGSPEHKKAPSKTRHKVTRNIKSVPTLREKFAVDRNKMTNIKPIETNKYTNNDEVENIDTDLTVFYPKLVSTQYSHLPPDSKFSNDLENRGINESEMDDETLFIENVAPSQNLPQKPSSSSNSAKKRKFSLSTGITGYKIPSTISKSEEIFNLGTQTNIHMSSSTKLKDKSPPRKIDKLIRSNFDIPTKKRDTSPTYVYKGSPVRKKAERALLNGWSCNDCQKFYEDMGLNAEELQNRKNQCSRHRSKYNEKKMSQPDYWEPDFSSSYHSTIWTND